MYRGLEEITLSPLCWPEGRARAVEKERRHGWQGTIDAALRGLKDELERSAVTRYRLSLDRDRPACALWFEEGGDLKVLACDVWESLAHNIKAIQLTLQRMRLIEEYGCYSAQAAREGARYGALVVSGAGGAEVPKPGFLARVFGLKKRDPSVAPPPHAPRETWAEVLGVSPKASAQEIEARYRDLVKKTHPDRGGSVEAFQRVVEAWDAYREAA